MKKFWRNVRENFYLIIGPAIGAGIGGFISSTILTAILMGTVKTTYVIALSGFCFVLTFFIWAILFTIIK